MPDTKFIRVDAMSLGRVEITPPPPCFWCVVLDSRFGPSMYPCIICWEEVVSHLVIILVYLVVTLYYRGRVDPTISYKV